MTDSDKSAPSRWGVNPTLLIGGLLIIIVVTLGWLWLQERRARTAAHEMIGQLQRQIEDLRLQQARLGAMFDLGRAGAIGAEDLEAVSFSLSGTQSALMVRPEAVRRLGFGGEELILVLPAGRVRPTSLPAPAIGAAEP